MKRSLVVLVGLFLLVGITSIATHSVRAWLKCDANGNCVSASSGWFTCNSNPGGTCDVSDHCPGAASGELELVAVTLGTVFRGPPEAINDLFPAGTASRSLHLASASWGSWLI